MTCSQCNDTGIRIPSSTVFRGGTVTTEYHTDRARTCSLCDGTGEQKRGYPFSCGSEAADWKDRNCAVCIKGYDDAENEWRCDLERSIDEAYFTDGSAPLDVLRRMGLDLGRDCLERVERSDAEPAP